VALIGGGYFCRVFIPGSPQIIIQVISVLAILIFYSVNLTGLKMSARVQNILMIIKIIMLLMIITGLFDAGAYNENNVPLFQREDGGWKEIITSFGLCLIGVSFTYEGYEQTINFGSEVKNPSSAIPKAIFIGITMIIVLYLLVNFAYYKIIGFNEMKNSSEIASMVIGRVFGTKGADVFAVLLFFSVLAYVNVALLSNPRVMFAMSEDGVLPKFFQYRSDNKGVFVIALSFFSFISIVVVFFAETFEKILSFSIFLDSFGMVTSVATIFILRKRTRNLDGTRIYKMRLFPLIPIIFIAAYTFVNASIIINTPFIALIGTAILTGFLVLYFIIRKLRV
jgi:APA family basic amino acid/polyamine antiporter